ncbi:two-component system, response regulator YesN [Lachnospiraceae bacterium G11]|nr:two-component system, response regulator YesN [Lachnospiraceae bacterium G11]
MKVFLVDDEIVVREGIRESFPWDDSPYTLVGEAPDGEMAIPMIRDTNPDIVITDIKMPFMDGIELCRLLRSQLPWIGIIVLSGYDEFEYARQCIQLGVREYLLKPINAEDLRQALDKVSGLLKEERRTREHAESLRARTESDTRFLREKLLGSLFSEDAMEEDAVSALEQLRTMGYSVHAPFYVVIDAAFSSVDKGQPISEDLALSSSGSIFATKSRTGSRILVLGDTVADAEERVYAAATSLAQELERAGCETIRIGIGDIVDKPGDIFKSFKAARHIRHILVEKNDAKALIFGTREMGDTPTDKKSSAVISEAKLYMSKNFTDSNLMLQDVAKAVNMSNSRFSTVFSQQNGQTFTEYLIYLRLKKAKELLRTTDKRSSQIAFDVGYNDAHYFSYIFKKNVGMTPSEYRAQNS